MFRKVKGLCGEQGPGRGKAASELVRRSLHAPLQTRVVNGFHVCRPAGRHATVSTEDDRKLQDE